MNNKIYFAPRGVNYWNELWSSNGTSSGTINLGGVSNGTTYPYLNTLLNFNNKIIFWAYNYSAQKFEMWQYLCPTCPSQNLTMQSGAWASSSTWSLGRVPDRYDNVIIKANQNITIPNNYRTELKSILTEAGAILNIPSSATVTINPNQNNP
jgi:hypothetical protein